MRIKELCTWFDHVSSVKPKKLPFVDSIVLSTPAEKFM